MLVIDEGGRRAWDEGGNGGGRGVTGVSRGWDVPGIVRTVEKVLNFLGGSGEVGCVDVVNGRPVEGGSRRGDDSGRRRHCLR